MQAVKPSLEDVSAALLGTPAEPSRGNTIPVYVKLPAELITPVTAYLRLTAGAKLGEESFLLESVTGGERVARYSFIGNRPFATLRNGTGCFFFQAEDGIRDPEMSSGLGDVYKRQGTTL